MVASKAVWRVDLMVAMLVLTSAVMKAVKMDDLKGELSVASRADWMVLIPAATKAVTMVEEKA